MPVQNNSTTPAPPRQRFPTPEERYGPDVEWVRLHDYQDPPEIGLFVVEISCTPQTGAFGVRVLGHPPGNYTKPPTIHRCPPFSKNTSAPDGPWRADGAPHLGAQG